MFDAHEEDEEEEEEEKKGSVFSPTSVLQLSSHHIIPPIPSL
jgi:hypothetical protein